LDGDGRNAAVSGFASGEDFVTLLTMAFSTDLTVLGTRASPGCLDAMFMPAEFPGSGPPWSGALWNCAEIEREYGPACDPATVAALCAASQVTLVDPLIGRNGILWPALQAFAARCTA
jgi:hypothetical protein